MYFLFLEKLENPAEVVAKMMRLMEDGFITLDQYLDFCLAVGLCTFSWTKPEIPLEHCCKVMKILGDRFFGFCFWNRIIWKFFSGPFPTARGAKNAGFLSPRCLRRGHSFENGRGGGGNIYSNQRLQSRRAFSLPPGMKNGHTKPILAPKL